MKQSNKNEQNWVEGEDFHPNVTLGVEILPAWLEAAVREVSEV